MKIEQFYDESLAHASYAIVGKGEMALIDPARDPQPYYDFAKQNQAEIVAVFETHPHADFVSSHLEIHETTGATIYVNSLLGAEYPHRTFDDGDGLKVCGVTFKALHTPGHSPDSNSILLFDENGEEHALFTGDTLFVGDVGRPDLRENVGNIQAKAQELAQALYRSTREKIMTLPEDVRVYPAHGAGSLCGKNISSDLHSTIGREIRENYALQAMSEAQFVNIITENQPWVPKYFEYDVALNKAGAESFESSIRVAGPVIHAANLEDGVLIIDVRPAAEFRKGHLPQAINIPESKKFETWLGSVVNPGESFYLIGSDEESLVQILKRTAKIGYEKQVKGLLWGETGTETEQSFDHDAFLEDQQSYTIVDIRNDSEVEVQSIFENAVHIPLPRLREHVAQVPTDKPIVVHCAGGLRSAIGASLIARQVEAVPVLDMGEYIKQYNKS